MQRSVATADTPAAQRARELVRELRASGFDETHVIELATQLLAQVTERLGRATRVP